TFFFKSSSMLLLVFITRLLSQKFGSNIERTRIELNAFFFFFSSVHGPL
ncbi:hypothetical protein DBR06_SOUSAS9210006, partial [Sousa chinensis]